MKKNKKALVALAAVSTLAITYGATGLQNKGRAQAKSPRADLSLFLQDAFAAGDGSGGGSGGSVNDACRDAFTSVIAAAPASGTYANNVLQHFHKELYRLNDIQPADIEMVFCRLINLMEVDPDLSALPITITKSDPSGTGTIVLDLTAPTETFAASLGYVAKAEVKFDDVVFMTLWWKGSGDSSAGYLIQGSNPMKADGNKRLRYVQWDRTVDTQTVKFFGTQFASSYLGSATAAAGSPTGGDHAVYGRLSYGTTDESVEMQTVEIRGGRVDSTAFRCVRTHSSGTIGGELTVYHPDPTSEEATSGTGTDGTGLSGSSGLVDSTSTANGAGTSLAGSTLATGSFDISCGSVNDASGVGRVFESNAVDFTLSPDDVF